MRRIVLAYSGGFETSVAIPWLKEKYTAEIITVTADLGQGRELEAVRDRALALGAVRAHVLDVREEFAHQFILAALKADALYDDGYPLAPALAWPLIADKLAAIAEIEQAEGVAHGSRKTGIDPVPLEVTIRARNPALTVLAPSMTAAEIVEYARDHGIPEPPGGAAAYNADVNLWGRSVAFGAIEDPWREAPDDLYVLTKSGPECPNEPAYVELSFERGTPVAINGVSMPLVDLIGSLTTIAGAHGVGRVDTVEDRLAGGKLRRLHEAPAAVVLHTAHRELQKLVTGRDLDRFSRVVRGHYAEVVCNGLWFSPLREALDAFIEKVQERVTGDVRLKLFKTACRTVGRKSPNALIASPKSSEQKTLVASR
jgi:argininosuccinate synthase